MKARCERDGTEFDATPMPYPSKEHQRSDHCANGDLNIGCPTCGRWYFLTDEEHLEEAKMMIATGPTPKTGDFVSDRVLTLL